MLLLQFVRLWWHPAETQENGRQGILSSAVENFSEQHQLPLHRAGLGNNNEDWLCEMDFFVVVVLKNTSGKQEISVSGSEYIQIVS